MIGFPYALEMFDVKPRKGWFYSKKAMTKHVMQTIKTARLIKRLKSYSI